MKRRVVVTGLGAVTPIGNTVDVFWDEIKKETVGIGPITQFDVSDYKVKIAAQVKGFDARERLDFKSAKRMDLSWEKEQALLFWKNWNMRRQGAQKYTQSLQGTEQRRTHGTSHHRQKTERAPQWR